MDFNQFWIRLSEGGVTNQGDRYSVIEDNKLHIQSPGNQNENYRINEETVEEYFNILHNGIMTNSDFRYSKSAYFSNIYMHIIGQ